MLPVLSVLLACGSGDQPADWVWDLPEGFPEPVVPEYNPMSAAKAELGRHLFFDARLSGNGEQSCGSCHLQELAFTDGLVVNQGSTGMPHPRNSQGLANAAYSATLTWANPALVELERQHEVPLYGEFPVELGIVGYEEEILDRFAGDPLYQELFQAAWPEEPDPFSIGHIIYALASYIRTLISGNSAYDRLTYQGDMAAMSGEALLGMELFYSETLECHHCHGGFNFTQSTRHTGTTFAETPFFNTGLYNIDGEGAYPADNTGLYSITGVPEDMGRFRPPSLRNVALTAPYMHDGSVQTLEEVIEIYAAGGRVIYEGENAGDGRVNPYKDGMISGFSITDAEREALVAFLESLTDWELVEDPLLGDPFAD